MSAREFKSHLTYASRVDRYRVEIIACPGAVPMTSRLPREIDTSSKETALGFPESCRKRRSVLERNHVSLRFHWNPKKPREFERSRSKGRAIVAAPRPSVDNLRLRKFN